jgi:tRNA(adenine34) deaminase
MEMALVEARHAFKEGEVPVGAVIVFDDKIVGRGYNRVEALHDASAHAEMIAMSAAYNFFGDWRLENCFLLSTLEPCVMCIGAALHSRIATVIFGASDHKFGACGSIVDIPAVRIFNHTIEVFGGVMADESSELMQQFFRDLRRGNESIN